MHQSRVLVIFEANSLFSLSVPIHSFRLGCCWLHRIKMFITKLCPRVVDGHVTLLIVFKYLNLIKLIGLCLYGACASIVQTELHVYRK